MFSNTKTYHSLFVTLPVAIDLVTLTPSLSYSCYSLLILHYYKIAAIITAKGSLLVGFIENQSHQNHPYQPYPTISTSDKSNV